MRVLMFFYFSLLFTPIFDHLRPSMHLASTTIHAALEKERSTISARLSFSLASINQLVSDNRAHTFFLWGWLTPNGALFFFFCI